VIGNTPLDSGKGLKNEDPIFCKIGPDIKILTDNTIDILFTACQIPTKILEVILKNKGLLCDEGGGAAFRRSQLSNRSGRPTLSASPSVSTCSVIRKNSPGLARIEVLMDAEPESPEEEELELLALLVETYEEEHYPIDLPDPVEAIKFRMDQEGLEPKDLISYIGSQSKVSEVLNYKRSLSLSMIRNLQEGLGIPAEVLIQKPSPTTALNLLHPRKSMKISK
jgi:HTH-type transcriptional regulator/antitoxin HigA